MPQCISTLTDSQLFEHGLDFYEVLSAADVLITDYSSVFFDFLLLDRPIIFTPSDQAIYKETRGFLLEPFEFWAPGPKSIDQISLQQTIHAELDEPQTYKEQRQTIRNLVHHYQDDQSSARVADLIAQQLSQA